MFNRRAVGKRDTFLTVRANRGRCVVRGQICDFAACVVPLDQGAALRYTTLGAARRISFRQVELHATNSPLGHDDTRLATRFI